MPEQELVQTLKNAYNQHGQYLYPVDAKQHPVGVLTRGDLHRFVQEGEPSGLDGIELTMLRFLARCLIT